MLNRLGMYMHFPWCIRKCPYCDFNSHPLKTSHDRSAYCASLLRDWHNQRDAFQVDTLVETVFMGGGTPSLFDAENLWGVIQHLPLSNAAEVTMEANPGSMEHAAFKGYLNAGVNRLSLGAQSFNDTHLANLGRIHSAEDTHSAFAQARSAGFTNINLDLMWGLPGQTVSEALADLDAAIELKPEHISWYQLTIEPKTEFARRPPLLPRENTLADMERLGLSLLTGAGYARYEVSAFAKLGHRCRHNLNYWTFGDYLGLGAGAHGKLTDTARFPMEILRTRKADQPRLYMADPEHTYTETVAPSALVVEFMMNVLRLIDGVPRETFTHRTGLRWSKVEKTWQGLADKGLVQSEACAVTASGLRYLDTVVAAFIE